MIVPIYMKKQTSSTVGRVLQALVLVAVLFPTLIFAAVVVWGLLTN